MSKARQQLINNKQQKKFKKMNYTIATRTKEHNWEESWQVTTQQNDQ